ncbi:hypothetical protein CRYUN_Cryun13aG0148700 [Craigia yunnanensis]
MVIESRASYTVSTRGLVRLDEMEGTSIGHSERLPIQVYEEEKGGVLVAAEAYFAEFGREVMGEERGGGFERVWIEREKSMLEKRIGLREVDLDWCLAGPVITVASLVSCS